MTGIENLVLFKTDEAGVARRAVEESDLIFSWISTLYPVWRG